MSKQVSFTVTFTVDDDADVNEMRNKLDSAISFSVDEYIMFDEINDVDFVVSQPTVK